MNDRRSFLKMAGPLAGMVVASSGLAGATECPEEDIVGTWNTVHTLPFPPGYFREYLAFSPGGTLQETNSFLNPASNVDFSAFGLPSEVNASDGMGNWSRGAKGVVNIVFRKLLFDGSNNNFADLLVTGVFKSDRTALNGTAHIVVVDPLTSKVVVDFGQATSEGIRLLG